MKVLFVCQGNAGRSQMAEAFFNKLSKKHKAVSAGTQAKIKKPIPEKVIISMKEFGIDVSKNKRKKLARKNIENADKIIVMCRANDLIKKAKKSGKITFWKVKDPSEMSLKLLNKIRNKIKKKVEELVKEIG